MNGWIRSTVSVTATLVAAVIFTLCTLAFLVYNLRRIHDHAVEKARTEARSMFDLNLAYRLWNAGHGGVYVPVTEKFQPNPYLAMHPKRDVTALDGTRLTLVNPAIMTRSVHEILSEKMSLPIINKVTSLRPVNPQNAPDEWEAEALRSFEKGKLESSELTLVKGQPYMRLLKPYIVEKGCLSCHAAQGYSLGDVRGGLSIGVPMKPYLDHEAIEQRQAVWSHFFIWLVGITGIGILGVFISRAERNTAKERIFTEAAVNSTKGLFFVLDEEGRYVRWNSALEDALGASPNALRGSEGLGIIHPEDSQKLSDGIRDVLVAGSTVTEVRAMPPGSEGTRDYLFVGNRMTIDGRPYAVVTGIDITKRKAMEDRIRTASAEWTATFDAIHDSIMILDQEHRILLCNKATAVFFNLPQEQIIGRHCWELAHDGQKPEGCPATVVMKTKTSGSAVFEVLSKTCMVTADPILDNTGEVIKIVHTIIDITEHKRLEAELNQAQKMEAIGALAGGVAHDFNNILTTIIGYASLMQDRLDKADPLRQYVDTILQSSERATALTKTLLSFSRKEKPELKPIEANAVVTGFQKILARLIGEDIDLTMNIFPEALNIQADKGQIEQVLMNLATNARDAMPKGGRLSVSTERVLFSGEHGDVHPGIYALISISDTGIGMDKSTQEHIFEPFFTTKEVGKGTGLGLSIVYGIVKNHGGSIHVYSEPGMGTTFKIILPLIDSAVASEPEPKDRRDLPTGTETILLAEDDADARQVARALLEECGYTVYEAVDGEDAVRIFRENKDVIDLVLTDLIMPKKNGREAYEEMKKMRPDIRGIFMSGYTRDIIARKVMIDEDMVFISKPLIPNELLNSIRKALQR